MKFSYEYRTGDNSRREGVVSAPSREGAFSVLRRQGIRPIRLVECPGVMNWFQKIGKRWFAIGVLSVVAVVVALIAMRKQRAIEEVSSLFDSPIRRQPVGDQLFIEKGLRDGWRSVFSEEGDRFLASFAIPGVPAAVRTTTEKELAAALERCVGPTAGDPIEVRQIKAMVAGVKDEMRKFLADGGTIVEYGQELVKRQELEIQCFNRVKTELDQAKAKGVDESALVKMWERRNEELRNIGVKMVPLPANSKF